MEMSGQMSSYNRNYYCWSQSDKDLIQFVKEHPIIHDQTIKKYHSRTSHIELNGLGRNTAIKRLWECYSRETKKKVMRICSRWKSIQDTYRRIIKRQKFVRTWSKYIDGTLSFLGELPDINSLVSRSNDGNVTKQFEEDACTASFSQIESPLVENVIDKDNIDASNETRHNTKQYQFTLLTPTTYRKKLQKTEKRSTFGLLSTDVPAAIDLTDEDIRALNEPVQEISKPTPDFIINVSDEDEEEPATNNYNKDMLLKTTILTQDMIEELLILKSNEEHKARGPGQLIYNENVDETNEETTRPKLETEIETSFPSNETVQSNEDILLAKDSVIHVENNLDDENDQDNLTTTETRSLNQNDKGASNEYGISSIDFYMEMGSYVIDHFLDDKQMELREKIWSLVQEELKLKHRKK